MRKIHRAVHFDFHTMPGIHDFNRAFDAAEFAQRLSDAHVDYINFFAHCNLGFAYFPTKVGIPYPILQGDMFGDILRECHARNIGVTAYLNVGLMHEQLRRHPEWCRMDKDGRIYMEPEENMNFFRRCCYNNPGYHDFLLSLIKEICEYDIDGLFCDCMHFFPCHCDQCTSDMLEKGIDIRDEEAVHDFSKEVMMRVSAEIKEIVGPDRYLYLNGMPYYEFKHLHTHAEVECLPSGGWGYDYFWHMAAYGRTMQEVCLYMTGRFQASWGDFGGYKGKTSLEHDVYDALCNGFLPSVGDHMHPAKNIEKKIYEDVGEIYARVMEYEKYTVGAKYKAEICALTGTTKSGYLANEFAGLARMLGELHLSFDIMHEDMDFTGYRLVILPDNLTVNEKLAARLEEYLAKGGKILSTGFGGTAPEGDRFALREYALECRKDPSNAGYFSFVNLPADSADMPFAMYEPGVRMTALDGADVRAHYVKSYFDKVWDGKHAYYYTPPEKETGEAAAAICGSVAHIGFKVFSAYYKAAMREHKLLVRELIDALLPDPLIRAVSGIPSTARVTATGADDYTLLHVKTTYPEQRGRVNIIEEHVTQKAGAQVMVRGEFDTVCLLPGETPVEHCVKEGHTLITLPEITGYDMFLLK